MDPQHLLQQIGFLSLAALLLAGCSGAQPLPTPTPIPPTATPIPPTPTPPLAAKRVLFVIQEYFNADEYGKPRATLEEKGTAVTVAAASLDVVTSYAKRMEVQPDLTWSDVRAADYDAIVFVGGYPYDTDVPEIQRIARDAAAEGDVVLAAICNAAIAIGKAGVLDGKRVTSLTYHPASELEKEGAILTDAVVERDGLIITGNGPAASQQFGEAIAAALEERG